MEDCLLWLLKGGLILGPFCHHVVIGKTDLIGHVGRSKIHFAFGEFPHDRSTWSNHVLKLQIIHGPQHFPAELRWGIEEIPAVVSRKFE
jgi:hypothetical protein